MWRDGQCTYFMLTTVYYIAGFLCTSFIIIFCWSCIMDLHVMFFLLTDDWRESSLSESPLQKKLRCSFSSVM